MTVQVAIEARVAMVVMEAIVTMVVMEATVFIPQPN